MGRPTTYKKIYQERMRCPCCGHVINDPRRFEWDHYLQTFEVVFGGTRGQKGRGGITYTEIDNPDYIEVMKTMVLKLGPRLGLTVVDEGAPPKPGSRRRKR